MILDKRTLILSSNSPRRAELLTKSSIPYIKRVIDIDESFPEDLPADQVAEYIATNKSLAHEDSINDDEIILTADTVVVHDSIIYGKPKNRDNAITTLLKLSDKVHIVYTGVCLYRPDKLKSFTVKSEVKFRPISEEEAAFYVDKDNPMDKAGSYGIQDWIGQTKIEWISGSYTNILGLPMAQVYDALKGF